MGYRPWGCKELDVTERPSKGLAIGPRFVCVFWLCWIFTAVCVLSLAVVSGGISFFKKSTGFLEHQLSSHSTQAVLLRGRWDLSRLGFEPMSPGLAGRFLTIELSGKPSKYRILMTKG